MSRRQSQETYTVHEQAVQESMYTFVIGQFLALYDLYCKDWLVWAFQMLSNVSWYFVMSVVILVALFYLRKKLRNDRLEAYRQKIQ